MNTRAALLVSLALSIAVCGLTAYVYKGLPDTIPTHWGADGRVNGWGPKSTIWIMPAMSFLGIFMLVGLPWLSPKNFSISSFRRPFNVIMVLVNVLFAFVSVVIVYATLNPQVDMTRVLLGGIMLFTGAFGNFLGKVRRNFYVGIRTPWTLASERVWEATHRLGARLMTACGLLGALALVLGAPPMPLLFVYIAVMLYPVLYSLILYKQLEKTRRL